MIIAGHTMGTPEYSLSEALELFARMGLHGAEVVWQAGYQCGFDPAIDLAGLEAAARTARAADVPIVALTPYDTQFNSVDCAERKAAIESYSRALIAAPIVGARWVRLYGGQFLPGDDRWDEKWNHLVDALYALGDRAQQHHVTICVENHFNTMADTAANTARLVRAVGHPNVRALYDQPNLEFIGGEHWVQALGLLDGLVSYVHVKDFIFKGSQRRFAAGNVSHVEEETRIVRSRVVGHGLVPWHEILRALYDGGYRGVLSLEYERRWHMDDLPPASEGMAESARKVRAWLETLS